MNASSQQSLRSTSGHRRFRLACLVVSALMLAAACGGGSDEPPAQARRERLSVSSTPLTAIPDYTVTNIGLGGTSGWVQPKGINASGQVAGESSLPTGYSRAFFFDGSAALNLGTFGGDYSGALALNNEGQVTGYAYVGGNTSYRAFSWKPGGSLVPISPSSNSYSQGRAINNAGLIVGWSNSGGFAWSEADGYQSLGGSSYFDPLAVNASGQMAGNSYDSLTGQWGGAIRQPDGTVTVVTPGSAFWAYAHLINDDALVGGYARSSSYNNYRAFAWQAGAADLFGDALAATINDYSYPRDLNQLGEMAGDARRYDPSTYAYLGQTGFVRSPTTLIADIGNLGAGGAYPYTIPFAINNHGQVVGYSGSNSVGVRAFTWTAATGIVDLNTKLSNPPPGTFIYYGLAISDNGSIVAYANTGLVLLKPVVTGPPPTAPALGPIGANDPVAVGSSANVNVAFTDVNSADTHGAQWSWGDGSAATAGAVTQAAGSGSATGSHVYAEAGVYPASVTVTDSSGRATTVSRDVVVYDPSAGFVTGGGWIDSPLGAYRADTTLAGRATFGFVSKYKKGATVPTGETEFQFHAAKLMFHSDSYDWLVVGGARAQYKGVGKLNGQPDYKFLLTAVDGALLAKGTADRFRIKIWHYDAALEADVVDYDNQIDASLTGGNSEGTAIGGGSIVIHK